MFWFLCVFLQLNYLKHIICYKLYKIPKLIAMEIPVKFLLQKPNHRLFLLVSSPSFAAAEEPSIPSLLPLFLLLLHY